MTYSVARWGRKFVHWENMLLTSISADGGEYLESKPVETPRPRGCKIVIAKILGDKAIVRTAVTAHCIINPSEIQMAPLGISPVRAEIAHLIIPTPQSCMWRKFFNEIWAVTIKVLDPNMSRGILKVMEKPQDGNMWVSYSMN